MHKQNVVGIVFRGPEGKKAIMQIMRAKPVKNKYTTTVAERSEAFIEATKDFFAKKW
jgi:hypothetical protein